MKFAFALRLVFALAIPFLIYFGTVHWALRPMLAPPRGLAPVDAPDAYLIRRDFPVHLVNPAWLTHSQDVTVDWIWDEVRARILLIAIFSGGAVAFCAFRRKGLSS